METVFLDPPSVLQSGFRSSEGLKRSRSVRMNPSFLETLESRENLSDRVFRFNLFPGTEALARLRAGAESGRGGRIYTGSVEGIPHSHVLLARHGDAVAASLIIPGEGTFQVLQQEANLYAINEVDPWFVPECGVAQGDVQESEGKGPEFAPRPWLRPQTNLPLRGLEETEDDNLARITKEEAEVEVMVVYTSQARAGAGGTDAILAQIHLAMAEANLVMANSELPVRFRLVHTAEVFYEESGDLELDLARIRDAGDGHLEEVHAWRDEHLADLVCLWVERSKGYAGLAYLATRAESGFSVVQRRYATRSYVFAHELGHNFGCDHDRESQTGLGKFSFSHGYRLTVNGRAYRTVMANPPGEVIPYFSNPKVQFFGEATGVPPGAFGEADNARTILETALLLDGYRGHSVTLSVQPSGSMSEGENVTLQALVESMEGPVEKVQFLENGIVFAEAFEPPYAAVWTNIPPGNSHFTARSFLKRGLIQTSPAQVVAARPANDDFANRWALSGREAQASTVLHWATVEPGEPRHFGPDTRTAWWTWTAPASEVVRLKLTGANDSLFRVAVYRGETLRELVPVAKSAPHLQDVYFQAREGEVYQIALIGEPSLVGVHLHLSMKEAPLNDHFANATALTGTSLMVFGSTVGASREPGEPTIGLVPFGHSIWYELKAPLTGRLQIRLQTLVPEGKLSPDLAVFTGDKLSELKLVANSVQAGDGFRVEEGTAYYIGIDGPYGEVGFTVNLPYGRNDHFRNRQFLPGISSGTLNVVLLRNATREPGEPIHGALPGGRSLWWRWRAPADGAILFSNSLTVSSQAGQIVPAYGSLAVYTGNAITNLVRMGSMELIGGGNDVFGVPVTGGVEYQIAFDSDQSLFTHIIPYEFKPVPLNDHFSKRFYTNQLPQLLEGATLGATAEPGEPFHSGRPPRHSVWRSFQFPATGLVAASVAHTSLELPRLAVYQGESLETLIPIADNRFGDNLGTVVVFEVKAGETMHIAVDEDQSGSSHALHLEYVVAPPNDSFSNSSEWPLEIASGANRPPLFLTNIGATRETGEPDHTGAGAGHSVWFHWTASGPPRDLTIVGTGFYPRAQAGRNPPALVAPPPSPFIALYENDILTDLMPVTKGLESVRFFSRPGITYRMAIDGAEGHYGNYLLRMMDAPANDQFEQALELDGALASISFPLLSAQMATRQEGEANHAGRSRGNSLWWKWTPQFHGTYSMELPYQSPRYGPIGLTQLGPIPTYTAAIYTGDNLSNLQVLSSNRLGSLVFQAHPNTTYFIAVDLEDQKRSPAAFFFHGTQNVSLSREPEFRLTRSPGDSWNFRVEGAPGQKLVLQASPDLFTWTFLTNVTLQSDYFSLEDWVDWERGQNFFRFITIQQP